MMKKFMTICAFVVLLVVATPAPAYLAELVDLGTPGGEAGYGLLDWGPVEPTSHPGGWGGIATDFQSWDNLCRTVWSTGNANWASITFDDKILAVEIRHLVGQADDSFDVHVDGVKWGSYADVTAGEVWEITAFTGTPGNTLKITATGLQWSGFQTYGQLGIDRVFAVVPEPTTLLLFGGAGLIGWLRRRRAL
jgi:hypothetical protein